MGRDRIYKAGQSAFEGYISDRSSSIGETFALEIADCLREMILPGELGERFKSSQAELYVEKRQWVAGVARPGNEFVYEELIHRYFWPSHASDRPLLIVSGAEGIGKSTLIRFYFDCYLPNYDKFPYVKRKEWNLKNWEEELNKHLVLYCDLRHCTTPDEVKKYIFRSFREQLTKKDRFRDISVQDEYAMWDRAADWNDPLHNDAEKAYGDRRAYRADYIKPLFLDNELFVEEALWYLGRQKDRNGNRKYYITKFLDNVDQQDWDMKKYILKTILGWIKSKEYHWKVILPLRPETLRELRSVLQPLGPFEIVELGELDQQSLINKRSNSIEREIKASQRQVEREEYIDKDGNVAYSPIPNFRAADHLRDMMSFDVEIDQYSSGKRFALRPVTRHLVEKFCNGSVRRFLRLRKRLAMSIPVERAARQKKKHRYEPLPEYIFLNGILNGGRDHYHRNDPDNDIENLYDTTNQPPCAYTLLIGVHILYLIRARNYTRQELLDRLTRIGYREGEVLDCLDTLHNAGLFTRENIESSDDYRIIKESNIIEAYVDLILKPAYTDNMAIVTPVEEHLGEQMVHTVAYEIGQFKDRTKTTKSFLRQVHDDENTIRTWRFESPRHRTDGRTFKRDFDSLGIPSIYRKAALEYRNRLEELKKNPKGLVEVMKREDWDDLLNDPVLIVETSEVNMPLKAFIA